MLSICDQTLGAYPDYPAEQNEVLSVAVFQGRDAVTVTLHFLQNFCQVVFPQGTHQHDELDRVHFKSVVQHPHGVVREIHIIRRLAA